MIATLALAVVMAADTGESWMGRDKVKHFFVSALVHGVAYSAARSIGSREHARIAGGGAVVVTGLWKELADRRAGRPFSVRDLAWGMAGGTASAALLNGAR
jgi:uncharacterized protein YfiM (DUF2279 family)